MKERPRVRFREEFHSSPVQVVAALVGVAAVIAGASVGLGSGSDGDEVKAPAADGAPVPATGVASSGQAPGDLSLEETEIVAVVGQAQTSFRDRRVRTYCTTRAVVYLEQAYGGGFPFASCVEAGAAGLRAEHPDILRGAVLDVEDVDIEGGEGGTEATVRAVQEGKRVEVEVTRQPPDDDVWRVARFDAR